ncbi:MAG TPA: NPCBM/NEW2 domain-containing protein [Planctomycetota bacterium]|nr:NPCBM/NEW2 domain-containing protein [Planctomycetota bacterium]
MRTALNVSTALAILCLALVAAPPFLQAQVSKIYLGDIAAGGDGTGTALPEVIGIHPDTGLLDEFFTDAPIGIGDGLALQPVDDDTSELIDSVFILELEEMPINSTGVTFTFPPEDLLQPPQTWGQILNNRVGGEMTPIALGGIAFEQGVGIHSAAGITYDLEALRALHGPEKIGQVLAHAGMGDSAFGSCRGTGWVTAYILLSDDAEVLDSAFYRSSVDGMKLLLTIPPEAQFLTLASGAGNGAFNCNSGTFGDAFIAPLGVCLAPAAAATRDLISPRTAEEGSGDFREGDLVDVEITISELRAADENCSPPAGIVVEETLPAGWPASDISSGGTFDPATSTIRWTLTGPDLVEGKKLTYRAAAQASADLQVVFAGTVSEDLPSPETIRILGESTLQNDIPFDACGGIRSWNILGAFMQPFGDNPGDDNLRLDYLTDGDTTEADFQFFPGAQVDTAFGGDGITAAASTGIIGGDRGRNPDGVPTVFAWNDADGRIDLNDEAFGGDPDNVMAYAQAYIINTTGDPIEVYIGSSSDDSIQIFLNGEEAWIHSIARGGSDACTPQDVSPDGFIFADAHLLEPGENSILVKVWEGLGGWDFTVRFQDASGQPITEGLEVSKFPDVGATVFHRGDADGSGELQLTDAIHILGFLFLGGAAPPCMDAADTNDDGRLQLTDAVQILGFLFQGGTPPAPPGPPPSPCGEDPPGGESLGCEVYEGC